MQNPFTTTFSKTPESPSLGFSTIFFESLIYIELLPVSIFAGFFVV